MSKVVELEQARLEVAVKRGYRNWRSRFKEEFGLGTRLSDISFQTLSRLAQGKEQASFYLYDLIINLHHWGSGLEFNELSPQKKMVVIDEYLFVLDRIRFETMKRLGWLESYPGEQYPLVDLVLNFKDLAPELQARVPMLSSDHPDYGRYLDLNTLDRETLVRRLIPKALRAIQDHSTTL